MIKVGGNVEAGKGLGSIAGGALGGLISTYLVVGVATGSVGLIVLGIAAAGIGYGMGKGGEAFGEGVANFINETIY